MNLRAFVIERLLRIRPSTENLTGAGEIKVDSSDSNKIKYYDGSTTQTIASESYVTAATGSVSSSLTDHINDTTDAHNASAISVVPAGNLAATDVQNALEEIQTDADSALSGLSGKMNAITSVDNTVPRFDGTAGQVQTSGVIVDDSNNISGIANLTITGNIQATAATNIDIGTSNSATTVDIGIGTGANTINIGGANSTINMTGTVNNQNVTNLNVTDKLITINDGGSAASGAVAGIEIEEGGTPTGQIVTSADRNSWEFKAPNTTGVATLTPGSSNDTVVLRNASETLANKTLTTPITDVITLDGQGSTPSNPSAGFYKAYVKDGDGKAYLLNSSGIEMPLGSTDWSTPVDSNILPDTNTAYTIGDITNQFSEVWSTAIASNVSLNIYANGGNTNIGSEAGSLELYSAVDYINIQRYNNGISTSLRFKDGTDTQYIGLKAPSSLSGSTEFTLPAADGISGQVLSTNGSGTLSFVTPESGGGISYFNNIALQANLDNISTYDDTGAYVDGTGGAPSAITISRRTSSPLDADGDLQISKAASSATGEGVTLLSDTVDIADRGRKLWIRFEWDGTAANYVSGDVKLYAYSVTNAEIVTVIPVAGCAFDSSNRVELPKLKTQVLAYVIPKDTTTQLRVSLHIPTDNASASAYDVFVARPRLSPEASVPGAIVTSWQNFPSVAAGTLITAVTSNPTYGTVATNKAMWRRNGENMEIVWQYRQTSGGTAGTGAYLFNLPAGYSIDLNKVTANTGVASDTTSASASSVGGGNFFPSGVTWAKLCMQVYDATRLKFLAFPDGSGSNAYAGSGYGPFSNANTSYSMFASVPIQGWSSSAALSTTEIGLQTAVMRASGDPASASSGAPVIFPTRDYDNFAAYNVSTGLYTAPKTGRYRVHGFITSANTGVAIDAAVNGTAQIRVGQTDSNGECAYSGTVTANAGDTISIEPGNTLDAASGSTLCIEEVPDFTAFSTLFDNTDVELYLDTGNGSGATNTNIRRFTNIRKQSGNGIYYTYADSSTLGMSITINVPGLYQIEWEDFLTTGSAVIGISVNGTVGTGIGSLSYANGKRAVISTPGANAVGQVCALLRLSAGDVVRAHSQSTTPNGTADSVIFRMIRVGN